MNNLKTWFTSDTHFGSERTLKFSKRPFQTIEEMDNTIIDNWNKCVKKDDTVFHLGDFGNYNTIGKLNGKIILVVGNYDLDYIDNNGFDELDKYFNKVMKSVVLTTKNGDKLFLNHFPSNKKDDMFNLFGHIHKSQMIKKYGLNVGTDCHNFCPIDIDTIIFYKNAIENHYDNEVFN